MKGNKVIFSKVKKIIGEHSRYSCFAESIEAKREFYEQYLPGEDREDLLRLYAISRVSNLRVVGGHSHDLMMHFLDNKGRVEELIDWLKEVDARNAIIVFDSSFLFFNTLKMDGEMYLLCPVN